MTTSADTRSTGFDLNDDDDTSDNIDEIFLTFVVRETEYAACLAHVTEIVVGQRILPIPDVPPFVVGVINLRGRVIPIMDVGKRFGFPQRPYDDRLCIIVVEVAGSSTGLAVDGVRDVLHIPSADIAPAIQHGRSNNGLIKGIGKHSDGVTFILDLQHLLDAEVQIGETFDPMQNIDSTGAHG